MTPKYSKKAESVNTNSIRNFDEILNIWKE